MWISANLRGFLLRQQKQSVSFFSRESVQEKRMRLNSTIFNGQEKIVRGTPILSDNEIARICDAMKCEDELPIADAVSTPSKLSIEYCRGCRRQLNWPIPKAGFWASPVNCPECDRWYFVEGRNHATPLLTDEAQDFLDQQVASSFNQAEVHQSLFGGLQCDDATLAEQYETAWHSVCSWVVGVPLTEKVQSVGVATKMTLAELTYNDATLVTTGTFSSTLLLLDFTSLGKPHVQLLASVLWNHCEHGTTKIGCRFLHAPGTSLPLR